MRMSQLATLPLDRPLSDASHPRCLATFASPGEVRYSSAPLHAHGMTPNASALVGNPPMQTLRLPD